MKDAGARSIYTPESPKGAILVLSNRRNLNLFHAKLFFRWDYKVITAVAYTDVVKLLQDFPDKINVIVIASLVLGWHANEGEERPEEIPQGEDNWQARNIRRVIDLVKGRQEEEPSIFVAEDLIKNRYFEITREGLEQEEISSKTYRASDPKTLIDQLEQAR